MNADLLVKAALEETGLDDFGGDSWREGLDRLCDSTEREGDLNAMGTEILGRRLTGLLASRLRVEATYKEHPEIDDVPITAPIFIIGLPRTGTTATSHLLSLDPQIRSLRTWESADPVPPPEQETEHSDPRIAATQAGIDMMYELFPRMKSLYFQTAESPTECQDLLGMEFRTSHFDGMAHCPSYVDWVIDCDMTPAYRYHHRTLQLLQWHCPPETWHLKTPVHMLSIDALDETYSDARFLWTHRDPADVLGSVCDLIAYTRSWVSDRDDSGELGPQQLRIWTEALRRATAFRDKVGESRFADIRHADLQTDPVGAFERAYDALGLTMSPAARNAMATWASEHHRGDHGEHVFDLQHFGLDAPSVRAEFAFYLERFNA
ncbi:MAG: sulfotransferase family protein [Actinomycetes bacterium]